MNLKRLRGLSSTNPRLDVMVDSYLCWHEASLGAAAAYRDWQLANRHGRELAFDSYQAALDREEHAASAYQQLVEQVGAKPARAQEARRQAEGVVTN
jgi:hypothetical protein